MSHTPIDPKSLELVQKASNQKNLRKGKNIDVTKNFVHFLLDFNIVPTAIAYIIALASVDFIKHNVADLVAKHLGKERKGLSSLITFVLIVALLYVFVMYVYYKFVVTEEVIKENVIKKAIGEKKTEEVKKEIDRKPELKKEISKEAKSVKHVEKVVKQENREKKLLSHEPFGTYQSQSQSRTSFVYVQ